jgi:PAS domain S-box-containing protein
LLVLKLGIDITERVKAEAALYQEKERYRILVEESPLGISIIGPKGEYQYLNPRFVEIFGYTREDIPTGREWFARAHPDLHYRRGVISTWIKDLEESRPGEARLRTFPVTCKDGTEKVINFRPVSLENGSQMVIYEDITDRHRAQEALIESEGRFRQLVEHAADALFLHDKGKIIEVNQQACDSLGYAREELLKMAVADLEVAISSHDLQKSWGHKLKSPVTIRGVHRRKDGSTFPVEVRAGDIIYGGRHLRLALVRDITERLKIEEAYRQSEMKYRTLVEAAPSGISIIGKDGRYKYLNTKFEKIFGYTLDDIPTGREWFPKAFPDSSYREMVISDWKKEFKNPKMGEVRPRTFRVTCKDGTVKVIDFRSVALATGDWLIFYEDISKRVQVEEALAKSEEQYRLLVNQIPAVVFKGYADGRVEFFDRKIESLTGYNKEDFDAGRLKWTDLILPEDAPGAREAVLKALRGNGSYVREYRIRKKDDGILWIQGRGQIFCNAPGQIDYISGVLFDISERKLVEEALRQSELKYRTLVEQIPAVVFQGYMDWSIDYFDSKIEVLTGYAKEDFDSRRLKWADLIPAEEMDYVRQTFVEALKTDRSYVREHRIRKKNGEYAWVQCRGRIFCDADGKAEYVRGVVFDITARKKGEGALKESEARYRLLAENVSDVIWTADMNLKLSYVSPSSKLLIGFSPEEVIQQGLEAILTPVSLEQIRFIFAEEMLALIQEPRDPSRSRIIELELIRKDGSIVWAEVKASFLWDEHERPVGILGVSRDISKRKQVELALRRREAILEAVSFAAGKFLQTASWEKDIQNILGRLGQSADASRVYIFENHLNGTGDLLTSQRYEWVAPGIEPQIDNLEMQNISWREAGFGRWEEQLSQGQLIVGHAWEFPPSEQELLTSQDIKSILLVPIFVGPQWWGMIGLDECRNEREWSPAELEALKTAAGTLGAAILHERAEQALRKSERKLRSLTAQLLSAQENERKRLAAELHDELGHALLILKLSIRSLEKQLTPEQTSFTQEFKKMGRFIAETIKGVRRLYLDLSPGDLEDLGLTEALRSMVEDVASLQKKIKWEVILDNLDGLFSLPVQTAIYRVVQEALTNIGKHAKAKNVSIVAKRGNQWISIIIEDDGAGFETAKVLDTKRSLGLLTMEERVKILGGTFTLWSQKKRGTRISFAVPFPEGD